jgi:hypothetical protein
MASTKVHTAMNNANGMEDLYTSIRKFANELISLDLNDWALKLINSIEGGSTSGEILMAIRWNLQELLRTESLSDSLQQQAKGFINEIDSTGV